MVICDLNLKYLDQIIVKRFIILIEKMFKMVIFYFYVLCIGDVIFLYIYYKDIKSKFLYC